jgi:hypothetical protein
MHYIPPIAWLVAEFLTKVTRLVSLVQHCSSFRRRCVHFPSFCGVRDVQSSKQLFSYIMTRTIYISEMMVIFALYWQTRWVGFVIDFSHWDNSQDIDTRLHPHKLSSIGANHFYSHSIMIRVYHEKQTYKLHSFWLDPACDRFMVFNVTFNNISVISCRSVLLVEGTGVSGVNHRPVVTHWQTWSHNVVSSTHHLKGIRTHNVGDYRQWLHR